MKTNSKYDEIIFGIRPVFEALKIGRDIEKVIFKKGLQGEGFKMLYALIKEKNIPFQFVPEPKLNHYTKKNHQGVIALVSPVKYHDTESLINEIITNNKQPFLLLLDHITDIRNFGAIARSAACAGVHGIIIPDKGAARINAEAIKTSAGALEIIPVSRSSNIFKTAVMLMEKGIKLIAASEKGNENHYSIDLTGALCIIMGSESKGIATPLIKMSDNHIKIPQYGNIGSLNVSVAAGIIVFEAAKQRYKIIK